MNIFILPIEPIDARYTQQWYDNIPELIRESAHGMNVGVVSIDGDDYTGDTTTGAFLNFATTNAWRADQVKKVSELFSDGSVHAGDRFLVTDAWNFVITPIRYMSELLNIPVEIHGIWHAGHYDPSDILGMKMSDHWPTHSELSWFHACDFNYFATDFHKNMFLTNLNIPEEFHHKAIRSGQPHEYIVPLLEPYTQIEKEDKIIWPHRYNADKQPAIAESLSDTYNMVITQKLNLSKMEYYNEMSSCKILFSCSLHENLGISVMEGVLSGVIPVLPDRCSYREMYEPEFLYPSHWTESVEAFERHRTELCNFIQSRMLHPENYSVLMKRQRDRLVDEYMSANIMIDNLLRPGS